MITMRHVKFTSVKLIFFFIALATLAHLFPEKCNAAQPFEAQIVPTQFQDSIQKTDSTIVPGIAEAGTTDEVTGNNSVEIIHSVETEILENSDKGESLDDYFLQPFVKSRKMMALKNILLENGVKYVPQKLRNIYANIINLCFQFPVVLFLTAFILFFILNILIVFLVLNYTLKRKSYRERYISVYGKMYEEVLLMYMFGGIDWDKTLVKLKKIQHRQNRRILISILLNFHENLKGEVDKFVPEIYVKLGLQNDSLRLANSMFKYRKVQGIRELTFLYSEGAMGIVSGLINNPNDHVRSEAQTAYIRLNPEKPFRFFKILTKAFSPWTQLSAFYLLRLHQLPVPSFADYLYSKHHTVRNFSLKMIIYFQQLENISEVYKMLESKMELTRYLSYRAINDLRLYDSRLLLKNRFRDETNKNKIEIVRAFKNIGTSDDFEFLEIIIKSEAVSLKLEACRSMYFMSDEGKERLLKLNQESNEKLDEFIAHITDPRN